MTSNPVAIADRVLALNEIEDFIGILNLGAPPQIDNKSSSQQLRKCYLKLSLIIHPDRMGKTYSNATKAFQALVKAYETLTTPELIEEVTTKGTKKTATSIARSNEGCFRTRLCCPRCKQPWNEGTLDGNPDYCYNFIMTGLRQYTCSTCLCEFGCMTAIHTCPHCKKQFEYNPSDYHKKIMCGNKTCKKEFGFWMFHASDRVIKETKQSVKAEQERLIKAREAKLRRAKRSGGDQLSAETTEAAFMMGLSDVCPRCGEDFAEIPEEEQRMHLVECTDTQKHRAYSTKKTEESSKNVIKEKRQKAQEQAQTQAAWQFLGASTTQLWLLNEDQLRIQAEDLGLDITGDKDELIDRIVQIKGSGKGYSQPAENILRLEETNNDSKSKKRSAISSTSTDKTSKKSKITTLQVRNSDKSSTNKSSSSALVSRGHTAAADNLPSDLHSYSVAQLRSMCAAQGLLGVLPKKAVKSDLLRVLNTAVLDIQDDSDED